MATTTIRADVFVKIRGLNNVLKMLERVATETNASLDDALLAEAELIMTEAKERTPVLTGALRASGHVDQTDKGVRLEFGGPSAPYAVYVHENLEAYHSNGQAKFLESAVLDALPTFHDNVAARMLRASEETARHESAEDDGGE